MGAKGLGFKQTVMGAGVLAVAIAFLGAPTSGTPLPEPVLMILFGSGLLGLARRWRKCEAT